MTEDNRDRQRGVRISEAALLAAAPAIGAALAFAFEAGFLHHFGLPAWLIRLDLSQIVLATLTVATGSVSLYNVLWVVPKRPWFLPIYFLCLPVLMGLSGWFVVHYTEWKWGWHLVVPVLWATVSWSLAGIWLVTDFMFPLMRREPTTSVWERWESLFDKESDHRAGSIGASVQKSLGVTGGIALVVVLFGLGGAYFYGRYKADGLVDLDWLGSSDCALIREYGSSGLCIDVDTARRLVHPSYHLVPLDQNQLDVTRLRIPNLKLASDTLPRTYLFRKRIVPPDSIAD